MKTRFTILMALAGATIAGCGSDATGSTESTSVPTPTTATATQLTPTPTASVPSTPQVLSTSTSIEPATTTAAVGIPEAQILRGDGLVRLPFGSPQIEVIAMLSELFGVPNPSGVAPELTTTHVLDGCSRGSETLSFFGSLIVGFSDHGDGLVLDSWSLYSGHPPSDVATERGVAVGATPDMIRKVYGAAAFRLDSESGSSPWWAPGQQSATVLADGGEIGLVELLRPGQYDVMSAGSDCPLSPLDPPPETTALFPDVPETVIDLTQAAPALVPTLLVSYPWSVVDDYVPGRVVAAAGPDRFAVLDTTSGLLDFLDSQTGRVVRSEQLPISPGTRMCCWLFFGPDDIVYVNHVESGLPQFVAYAPIAGAYVEVARQPHGVGDGTVVLGAHGIGVVGVGTPLMPFVGADGQPSGATLDFEPLHFDAEGRLGRGALVWELAYPGGRCEGCSSVLPGPGTSVVIVDGIPGSDSTAFRLTLLDGQQVSKWDTAWLYVGPLEDALLMQRIVGDQIEIGMVHV